MIYTLTQQENKNLEEIYNQALEEGAEFFGFHWTKNQPKVFLIPDRLTIDSLMGEKTPPHVVGWGSAAKGGIYLLSPDNYEKESNHHYSPQKYSALLKHELFHCFMDVVTNTRKPVWLSEGTVIYLSGQLQEYQEPERFEHFLSAYDQHLPSAYSEGGWVVKKLVDKFGKQKLLNLFKKMKESKFTSSEEFSSLFKENFSIDLDYQTLNTFQ